MADTNLNHFGTGDNVTGDKIIYNINSKTQRHFDSAFIDIFNDKSSILDKTQPINFMIKANDREVKIFTEEVIDFLIKNNWNIGNISKTDVLGIATPGFNGFYIRPKNMIIVNAVD